MAVVPLAGMSAASALTGAEIAYVQQGGADRKATISQIAAASNSPAFDYIATRFMAPANMVGLVVTGQTPTINTILAGPVTFPIKFTTTNIVCRVQALQAGGLFQLALYADGGGKPTGNPVATTASISEAATGILTTALSGVVQLGPGGANMGQKGWLCVNMDTVGTFRLYAPPVGWSTPAVGGSSAANALSLAPPSGKQVAQTFGTWPDLTGATFTDIVVNNIPYVTFDVTSAP